MISGCQKWKLALVLDFFLEISTSVRLYFCFSVSTTYCHGVNLHFHSTPLPFSPLVLTENQIGVNRPLLKFQSVPYTNLSYVFRTLVIKCTNHMDLFYGAFMSINFNCMKKSSLNILETSPFVFFRRKYGFKGFSFWVN